MDGLMFRFIICLGINYLFDYFCIVTYLGRACPDRQTSWPLTLPRGGSWSQRWDRPGRVGWSWRGGIRNASTKSGCSWQNWEMISGGDILLKPFIESYINTLSVKRAYHFFRATLTKIHHIKINYIRTQISYSTPYNNNNNNTWFLYALFPKSPKRLQYIITPVTGYISSRTNSAQFPLPWEYSLPGIAACDNGAGKFKHNNLSHPTGSPFIHLGREQQMWINCLAEGQKCRGDCETRTRTLSARVEWILQYTTTPPLMKHIWKIK